MTDVEGAVGIVVDASFGERIDTLPSRMPIWVVDTPVNRAVAQAYWPGGRKRDTARNITTFKSDASSPEEACVGILGTVDLHHNEYSQRPPYSRIEVFGTGAGPALRAALGKYGFVVVSESEAGLVAVRREASEERR